jgi:glyoxylase-like metal-dependent hydrolase (beta-lactamase superfamily II)
MKVRLLRKRGTGYSCNVYLVLGDWNRIEDVNTLVDAGPDGFILDELPEVPTGVGKVPVDQIVLTHNHFDHAAGVDAVKSVYHSKVLGFAPSRNVDDELRNGQLIVVGDRYFEVMHVPDHSSDSICLYCAEDGVLFSGDTPLEIRSDTDTHSAAYHAFLRRLTGENIRCIYPGHGQPITDGIRRMLEASLTNVQRTAPTP